MAVSDVVTFTKGHLRRFSGETAISGCVAGGNQLQHRKVIMGMWIGTLPAFTKNASSQYVYTSAMMFIECNYDMNYRLREQILDQDVPSSMRLHSN